MKNLEASAFDCYRSVRWMTETCRLLCHTSDVDSMTEACISMYHTSYVSRLKYVACHTLRSGFHCETYIGISPYRTLTVVELQSMAVMSYMT